MLNTNRDWSEETLGEITNWGGAENMLGRYNIAENGVEEFTLEELEKIGLVIGNTVVYANLTDNKGRQMRIIVAQADLEYYEDDLGKECGNDTIDYENMIDSVMGTDEMFDTITNWVKEQTMHYIIK